jgi:YceI-like domain
MKKPFLIIASFLLMLQLSAQDKYFTKSGKIIFDATVAKSPEKIEGVNNTVTCVIDIKTGNLQFAVLMKNFEFERALMQEHFNENYVETNKYPKAEFKGAIVDFATLNLSKEGNYEVKVKGKMSLHGQTKDAAANGKIIVKAGKIQILSAFSVLFSDYAIAIPGLVADKLASAASIKVDCLLEPFK